MKIAILGPYPLDTQRLSGVEVAIIYVQRELLKMADMDLHIITCSQQVTQPLTKMNEGAPVTYLPRGRRGRLTWHRREVAAICETLNGLQPDLVHAHTSGLYAGATLACNYPSVVTVHGIASQEAKLLEDWPSRLRGLVDSAYERWAMRRTRYLMSITPYVDQVFDGIFRGRSFLVENACHRDFFDIQPDPTPGRIFFAGPVIPRKGVLPLLRALPLVRQQIPEAHVVIAGNTSADPTYAQACHDFVAQNGLQQADTFCGHLAQDEVVANYARCAVTVLPSFQETAPMVIEQAMAASCPSVATRAGGVPWMIEDGITGWSLPVPPTMDGDPETLAEALTRILADPAQAREMGRRAKSAAEQRFRPEVVAQHTRQVYDQVLAAEGHLGARNEAKIP